MPGPTTGVVTLADVAMHTKDAILEGFVKLLLRTSKAMGTVPFTTKNVLSVVNNKIVTLPAGQTRLLNEGYTNVKGATESETFEPGIYGLQIQIDRQLEGVENAIESEASLQSKLAMMGFARDWTNDLFNGDRVTSPKAMNGLKKLVTGWQNARQVINVAESGNALDVTSSAAREQRLINAMHTALKYVGADQTSPTDDEAGGKVVIYLNENMYLGWGAALRAAGLLDTSKDQFGRTFNTFGGHQMVDVGLKSDLSTEVIPLTEDPGDGGNDSTSIYFVRWDETDGCIGFQKNGMSIYDPLNGNEMESVPAKLRRLDWPTMIVPRSDFCIARIKGVLNPASWTIPAV